jgi:hypothetical protein
MYRQTNVCVGLVLLAGSALYGQSQEKPEAFVRRFSAGATLTVLGLSLVPAGSKDIVTTTPPVDALYTTTGASQRIGYGATVQAMITGHFGLDVSLFARRIGYKLNTDIYTGVDDPNTVQDERIHTVLNEDTRAHIYDLPVVVRYYVKERHTPGPRFFVEGGGALRRISNLRSSRDITDNSGTYTCCTFTPAVPARRTVRGLVVGAGVQLNDPIGIRVVPEVRYTRWVGQTFSSPGVDTRRDQVEGMLSLTF